MFKKSISLLLAMLFVALATPSFAQENIQAPYKRGAGKFVFTEYAPLKDKPITVYYYIPTKGDIKTMRVLFVMHGAQRTAGGQALQIPRRVRGVARQLPRNLLIGDLHRHIGRGGLILCQVGGAGAGKIFVFRF